MATVYLSSMFHEIEKSYRSIILSFLNIHNIIPETFKCLSVTRSIFLFKPFISRNLNLFYLFEKQANVNKNYFTYSGKTNDLGSLIAGEFRTIFPSQHFLQEAKAIILSYLPYLVGSIFH